MCYAFSCLVLPDASTIWQLNVDQHEKLIEKADLKDDTMDPAKMTFCRVEISPKNADYLNPDTWELKIDQPRPAWWSSAHAEAAIKAHKEWLAELDKILIHKPIVNPFTDRTPPKKITKKHLGLVKQWNNVLASIGKFVRTSVRESVRNAVPNSVAFSVEFNVGDCMWNNVGGRLRNCVRTSAWDNIGSTALASVWAYVGSFFNLPRSAWKYTGDIEIEGYPFQAAVDLWEMGLVPSFDGQVWRLHGGPEGRAIWTLTKKK